MLATDNWCIKVDQRIYGPYTQDQMAGFAAEGRLSGQSLVSPAGGNAWREARQYPPLSAMLGGRQTAPRTFGKAGKAGDHAVPAEGSEANIIVIFDVTAGTAGRVDHLMRQLGTGFRITDNVWVVRTTQSALGVKNAIAPHLDVREPMFVVDASRGRTSWHNFVPELHSKLTKAWVKL